MVYSPLDDDFFDEHWWRVIPDQVKHIHYYNQLVVYEKGIVDTPNHLQTVGYSIPYEDSGVHDPVDWDTVLRKLRNYTHSSW